MINKRIKHIGHLFLSAFLLSSCVQEEPTGRGVTACEDEILFFTSLMGVQTRSGADIDKNSIKNGFDVSAACLDSITAKGDTIPIEYFSTQLVKQTEGMGEAFRADGCKWPSNKGTKAGMLRFFAFYPSREVLRTHAGVNSNDTNFFKLNYTKTTRDSKNVTEYWMKSFKVNKDIDRHTDFVTATVKGTKSNNLYSGVNLRFQHQLSKITLMASGEPESYDVEIAGVRIGGLALESDFSFEGKPLRIFDYTLTRIGRWTGVIQKKGCVEYVFSEGDTVVSVNPENYRKIPIKRENKTNVDTISATSIMGKGGPALLIPYDYTVWKYQDGYTQSEDPLYFSVLLRVKEKVTENKTLLYPYIEGSDMTSTVTSNSMNVVYLSIETSTGKVKKRLYRNEKDKKFYTDEGFSKEYSKPDTEDIRNYGWASAIPPTGKDPQIRWNPGFQYYYVLNYSQGIGVQDPADAFPGRAIIAPIEVTGTGTTWHTVTDFETTDDLKLEVQKQK